MAYLECINTSTSKKIYLALQKPIISIGSKSGNDLLLTTGEIAPTHATIVRRGDRFTINLLDRKRPFQVNGRAFRSCPLRYGDVIELSHFKITLQEGTVPTIEFKSNQNIKNLEELVQFSSKLVSETNPTILFKKLLESVVALTRAEKGFVINRIVDYTDAEKEEVFLEGTGSVILDRVNRKAYCALSPRADEDLCIEFCEDFEYTPVIFTANQTVNGKRKAIYHTNVMMCVAETFAVICLDSIDDKKERKNVLKHLREDGKKVIAISEEQVNNFAGNMLQVRGKNDELFLVMSQAAYNSLNQSQLSQIRNHCKIISSSLDTIEACGGGSARCMMAEIFLPQG